MASAAVAVSRSDQESENDVETSFNIPTVCDTSALSQFDCRARDMSSA